MATGRKRRKSKDNASIEVTSTRSGGVDIDAESVNIGGDVVGRDKIINNIVNTVNNIFLGGTAEARERRNLLILLNKVKSFWVEGVLEKSVHGTALIELGLQEQPEAVEHPWEMLLRTANQHGRTLSPDQKIVDIFNETGQALLILGEPGSGKTMTLLELTSDLIDRAEQDASLPIPTVFNLSSWASLARIERDKAEKDHKKWEPALTPWLVNELKTQYGIPSRMGIRWIENNDLILLLDGLDEVEAEFRKPCVDAINQFHQENGIAGIAICSRTAEYEELITRLKLNSAIVIQPLTHDQIDRYISSGGPKLSALRDVLRRDTALQELAQSPLMLSIMSLAYQGLSVDELTSDQVDLPERHKRLFNMYVHWMFARPARTNAKILPEEQVIHRLSWLARQMILHGHTVFLIELLQPSWLPPRLARWAYALGSRLIVGLLAGLCIGMVFGLNEVLESGSIIALFKELIAGLSGGVIGGLTAGFWYAVSARARYSPESIVALADLLVKYGVQATYFLDAVVFLLVFALTKFGPGSTTAGLIVLAVAVLFLGPIVGLIVGLIVRLIRSLKGRWDRQQPPYTNIKLGIQLGTAIMGWAGLLFLLIAGLTELLIAGVMFLLICAYGGRYFLTQDIQSTATLGWSWPNALAGGTQGLKLWLRLGLGAGLIVGLPMGLIEELRFGLSYTRVIDGAMLGLIGGLIVGIDVGLIGGVLNAMIHGLSSSTVETKTDPNQWIRLSLRTASLIGLSVGSLVGFSIGLIVELSEKLMEALGLVPVPLFGPLEGLVGGLFIFPLLYGGRDVIHHYILRLILYFTGHVPRNYVRILDYAEGLVFLRKVGGGYIFIHRLLQEYFASLEP